ncbi:hypothetical protein FCV25MIE_32276 [Fagus crenata]
MQRAAKLICDFREASAVSCPSKSAILTPELPKIWVSRGLRGGSGSRVGFAWASRRLWVLRWGWVSGWRGGCGVGGVGGVRVGVGFGVLWGGCGVVAGWGGFRWGGGGVVGGFRGGVVGWVSGGGVGVGWWRGGFRGWQGWVWGGGGVGFGGLW